MTRKFLFSLLIAALVLANTSLAIAAPGIDKVGINIALKTDVSDAILAELGTYGEVLDVMRQIDAIRLLAPAAKLPAIKALPYVEAANPDAQRKGIPIDTVTATDFADGMSTWDLDAINVTDFGTNLRQVAYDGAGVYVAVLDTGLVPDWRQYFPEERIAEEYAAAYIGGGENDIGYVAQPRDYWQKDTNSHGTHVASTILGYNYPAGPVNGVAPLATVIPVKVLSNAGSGWSAPIAAGIVYVADLKAGPLKRYPVVINMSLGGPERSTMIEEAVNYAISKGVIVVASAGNNGTDGMGYPGGLSQVISAAAGGWATMFNYGWRADAPEKLNTKDILGNNWQIYLEDFSSRPNKYLDQKHQDLDVTTPGAWVVGPYRPAFSTALGYYYVSGTSQAAPHVTAIAALVLQTHPDLTQAEMEAILENTARGIPLPADDAVVTYPYADPYYYWCLWDGGDAGAGFLQADAALKVAK